MATKKKIAKHLRAIAGMTMLSPVQGQSPKEIYDKAYNEMKKAYQSKALPKYLETRMHSFPENVQKEIQKLLTHFEK